MTDTHPPDVAAQQRPQARHLGWALALISITQLLIVLDGSIVTIATPYIGQDLDITEGNLAWLTIGYALPFGALLMLGGRLGDLFGYRRMLRIGMTGFAVASALGGVATAEPSRIRRRPRRSCGRQAATRSSSAAGWAGSTSTWVNGATDWR